MDVRVLALHWTNSYVEAFAFTPALEAMPAPDRVLCRV